MSTLRIGPAGPLRGAITVPGDKSISHRVLLLAALADGESHITGLSTGEDVLHTLAIIQQLGAEVDGDPNHGLTVRGGRLRAPDDVLYVGNSGTGIRLLAGFLAGLPFTSTLDGDASIRTRPMDRIIDPLRQMGARIGGAGGGTTAPLRIEASSLRGIDYTPPMASAQVKSAVLFAGLHADGPTVVREPTVTRRHTEELFAATGVDVSSDDGVITVHPSRPQPFDHEVAGDPSQAAFWAVGAAIVPGSEVTINGVYLGRERAGFLDVLARMGADVEVDRAGGSFTVRSSTLRSTDVGEAEIPGLDEIPILAAAAAHADGVTRFVGMGELRVKESDRLEAIEVELGRLGARTEADGDVLLVSGGAPLRGARIRPRHDHRIAMMGAIAALTARGETEIDQWECVATSYPTFVEHLTQLTGASPTVVASDASSSDPGSTEEGP